VSAHARTVTPDQPAGRKLTPLRACFSAPAPTADIRDCLASKHLCSTAAPIGHRSLGRVASSFALRAAFRLYQSSEVLSLSRAAGV
jgi:hypothetical protein